ncbi:MAG TPA: site-specific integrase [Blastocatellia bacterium]|nr:site-specific integrase [Blastocatellia bacterium]
MPIKRVKSKRFKSGYGYRLSINRAGLPRIRQTFESFKLARDVEEAILGDHVRRRFDLPLQSRVKLRDLIEKHLDTMKAKGRDKTNWKRAETVLNRFADLVGADRLVESIKTADLQEYASHRLAHGYKGNDPPKPQTINREMNEIKGCLSAAKRYYAALEDWQPPKGAWLEEPSDGRRQTWTADQITAILQELRAPRRKGEKQDHITGRFAVADMFEVALLTGMRAGEVRRLRKSQIGFTRRIIIMTSKKGMSVRRTAKTREIPLVDEAFDILRHRYEAARGDCLFPGRNPDKPLADHRPAFMTACERAKVPYGLDGDGRLVFNDARRTAENNMLEAGHQPRAVGDVLGHSPETMAKHYARSTARSRREAVEAATDFGSNLAVQDGQDGQTGQAGQKKKAAKTSN